MVPNLHILGSSQCTSNEMFTTKIRELEETPEGYGVWKDKERHVTLLKSSEVNKRQVNGELYLNRSLSAKSIMASMFCTDKILKFFTVIFYGIVPCGFKNHFRKMRYSCISLIFVLLQWNSLVNFIYFILTYRTDLKFSLVSVTLMIAHAISITVTYSLAVHYFYRTKNNFSIDNKGKWSMIPCIRFYLPGDPENERWIWPERQDWFLTNTFLFLGFSGVLLLTSLNIASDTFYGAHHVHNVIDKLPWQRQLQFHIATRTETFGSLATATICCIFYAITRDLVRHIEYTEKAILQRARNKDEFYTFHRSLHQYVDKMVASCRQWFAIHSLFYGTLVLIVVAKWFRLTKYKKLEIKYFYEVLIARIAGSLMVAFMFAFPFMAASRVTSRFSTFYFNIAMNSQIDGLPDLFILSKKSGFILYGCRIDTTTAILTFASCFVGLLRTWYLLA